RVFLELARFPCEVKWFDRNAMPAKAGSRIKRHKAKRVSSGSMVYFPDRNAHGCIDEFQLVDQGNVDAAKDILEQLGCLRDPARGNWDKLGHSPAVNRHCLLKARWGIPANDFWHQLERAAWVPRIFSFGRKSQVKIHACFHSRSSLQNGAQLLVGRSRISRRFEHDQGSIREMRRDRPAGLKNER